MWRFRAIPAFPDWHLTTGAHRVQGRVAVPEPEGEGKPPRLYAAGAEEENLS